MSRPAVAFALTFGCIWLAACETRQPPATTKPLAAAPSQPAPTSVATPIGAPTGTFLDRPSEPNGPLVRIVNYNVMWNSIFPEVDAARAAKFVRIVRALSPDILALQEIGTHPEERGKPGARRRTAEDVAQLLNTQTPLPAGATWQAHQGSDNVIVSRYPLRSKAERTVPAGDRGLAIALVDLPDEQFAVDLYLLNTHHKSSGGAENEARRQKQSDAMVNWVRDARAAGGEVELPPQTPIVILGDLNVVEGLAPLNTLLTGDIANEKDYGPDFAPDWDDTPLADAHPLHNITGPADWTWRNDHSRFDPGRLDYVIYSDSVLEVVKKYVLDTTTMLADDLRAAGLEKFDVTQDDVGQHYDHLPLVVDFRVTVEAAPGGGE